MHAKWCHNCIFKSGTQGSDASVHMDYYIALRIKAQDGHKVYWELKTGCKVFITSNSVQNTIASCHANTVMSSAIWLMISNPRSAPPLVTRNVAQKTRPSSTFQGGSGNETNVPCPNTETWEWDQTASLEWTSIYGITSARALQAPRWGRLQLVVQWAMECRHSDTTTLHHSAPHPDECQTNRDDYHCKHVNVFPLTQCTHTDTTGACVHRVHVCSACINWEHCSLYTNKSLMLLGCH